MSHLLPEYSLKTLLAGKRQPKRKRDDSSEDEEDEEAAMEMFGSMIGETLKGALGPALRPEEKDVYVKDNHIYFVTNVTEQSVVKLVNIIDEKNRIFELLEKSHLFETVTPKPLFLHITSYGGSLMACFRACDAIRNSKIPVNTIVDGHAASAGSLMAVVGRKRYMRPRSKVLIHQLSAWGAGKFEELKDDMENWKDWMKEIVEIYITHSNGKMKRNFLEQQLKHDSWWNYDKSFQYGLVDEKWLE